MSVTKMNAIDTLLEIWLFVRRHILHDILPICFTTFSPEHGHPSMDWMCQTECWCTAQPFHEFNLIAYDLAIVFNRKLGTRLRAIFVMCGILQQHQFLYRFRFWNSSIEITFHFVRIVAYSRYQNVFLCEYLFEIPKTKGFWMIDYSFRSAFQKPLATKQ